MEDAEIESEEQRKKCEEDEPESQNHVNPAILDVRPAQPSDELRSVSAARNLSRKE
jgi:hypothetical protein